MADWYAVYTRPLSEKKVAENFSKRKFESYCPLNWTRQYEKGKKLVQAPLFKSYVFVRLNEAQLPDAKSVDGVINFAYWLNKPAKVRDVEIEMLRRFLNVHKEMELEKTPVDMNAMVTLTEAPRRVSKDGGLLKIDAVGPQLLLPTLGYRLIAAEPTKYQSQVKQPEIKSQKSFMAVDLRNKISR